MKKNYKIYFSIIAIYAMIALVVLFYYIYSNHNNGYLILPGGNVYYKDHDKITLYSKNIDKGTNITVITESGTKKLKFKINHETVEFYDNDTKVELGEDFILAYSPNLKLNLADYTIDALTEQDMKKVSDILKEHDIIGYENLNTNFKVSFDYNHDDISKTIYFISNLFDETKYDKVFSFVYYIKNDKIVYLIEQVETIENTYDLCVPSVNSILNLEEEENYKLVISCQYFSDIGTKNQIYEQKNDLFYLINK